MPNRPRVPLRPLTTEEDQYLAQVVRAQSLSALMVARAKMLQSVRAGASYPEAARRAGRKDRHVVATLVRRFNAHGMDALERLPTGHPPIQYGPAEAERILAEFRRPPDLERDGTATWSLSLLQRALRSAPDGFPQVSTWTIFQVLHAAGYSWQKSRTWCKTGVVTRKRGGQLVEVTDPDAERKKG